MVVRLLLSKQNVQPGSKDSVFGLTPLSCAAMNGHHQVMRLLLSRHNTALSIAVAKGHNVVVSTLLDFDCVDPTSKDIFGLSPLSLAAKKGYHDMHNTLLQKAAEMGFAIQEADANLIRPLKPTVGNICCTFCMMGILDGEVYLKCPSCEWDGQSYIKCEACVARELTCLDVSHEWLKEGV